MQHWKGAIVAKITLQVIATETGLSKFAVSRALAGKEGVSDETRARVIAAAERLGYRRTNDAAALIVAAIFNAHDHINSEQHMQIQSGLQSEALKCDCAVRMHWSRGPEDLDRAIAGVDAIFAVNLSDQSSLALLEASDLPMLRSGWVNPIEPVSTISGTDHEAGSAVAAHLISLGHREIIYVHGDAKLRGRRERLYGLREVVENTPGAQYHDVSWDAGSTFSSRVDDILAQGGRPTAFFCAHDGLAITAVSDLLSRGWRIPEDVSVIGFGDFIAAQQIRPALTTVRVHGRRMGRSALRHLVTRLRSADWPTYPVRLQIPNTLIERSSTGPAPR